MACGSLASLGMATTAAGQTSDVALGIEALARRDVKAAEAAFRRGTTADNPLIRPAAWQWLGHVAWKFRGDTTAARRYLDRALSEARDSSQILLETARLLGARRRFRDAQRLAYEAMQRSVDGERRGAAARTFVELAKDSRFSAAIGEAADSVDLTMMRHVRDSLSARVSRFHGRTSDALALINAGAILKDKADVENGLRSYVAFTTGVAEPTETIRMLVNALVRARLYESVTLFMGSRPPWTDDFASEDAIAYGRLVHDLRLATDAMYRRAINGQQRVGDATRLLNALGRPFWARLHWSGNAPAFYPAALYRELSRRFGAVITIERSRGVEDLYLAHRQFFSTLRDGPVIALDEVVSSGIDDWLLDGTGGRAGWVARDTVYMRRTAFTETPFRALAALTDPQTIPGELFRIARDSVGDIARAKRDSLGYFPGVAARMFRSGAQALLDSVKTPEAFTRAMFDNLTHTSIDLHESRHRADLHAGRATTEAEAEFRAKLDEVTGAALPRLALTAILSPTIGDRSPHGQANRRIMIGLNRWIRRNGASIAGYDARVPALLQLPQLTDAQIKAAFSSLRAR